MDKADEARIGEAFLALLEEFASGKKRDTDEPLSYHEAVVKVTKTTTTQ